MEDLEIQKRIDDRIKKVVPQLLQSSAFIQRKLTDTPTDAFQVVSRRFVTSNGTTANRPPAPVSGQFYLDTTLSANGKPIWYGPNGWVDATGTLV